MALKQERPKKRDLIRWDEEKDVLILIAIHAHCSKRGIKIPWDDIGAEIAPTVTGNAVIQHISKLRKKREEAGKPVPSISMTRKRVRKASSDEAGDDDDMNEDSDQTYKGGNAKNTKVNNQSTKKGKAKKTRKRAKKSHNKNMEDSEQITAAGSSDEHGDKSASPSLDSEDDGNFSGKGVIGLGASFLRFDEPHAESSSQGSAGQPAQRKSMIVKLKYPTTSSASVETQPSNLGYYHHQSAQHMQEDEIPLRPGQQHQPYQFGYYQRPSIQQSQEGLLFNNPQPHAYHSGYETLQPDQQLLDGGDFDNNDEEGVEVDMAYYDDLDPDSTHFQPGVVPMQPSIHESQYRSQGTGFTQTPAFLPPTPELVPVPYGGYGEVDSSAHDDGPGELALGDGTSLYGQYLEGDLDVTLDDYFQLPPLPGNWNGNL